MLKQMDVERTASTHSAERFPDFEEVTHLGAASDFNPVDIALTYIGELGRFTRASTALGYGGGSHSTVSIRSPRTPWRAPRAI